MKRILISRKDGSTCAAVLSDGVLDKIYTSREDTPRLVGNIYKGRVQNVLPGMKAAFVDIGRDKNVFLQTNAQSFHVGQNVLIQIEKEEVGSKGARATLNLSLAGRFVIFLPTLNYIGVSNKIRGSERERLHSLAKALRPSNAGLIVRTAAQDCTEEILRNDLADLQRLWENIRARYGKRKAPALLHAEDDLISTLIRDEFTKTVEVVTDNIIVRRRLKSLAPEVDVALYEGFENIFEAFGIAQELASITRRELPLPSGGQIVFDKTEALTAVDVNTSKFIGRNDFDETILRTNLEAAELLLKQLRLRNVGGIIIVDFIDMENDAHRKILMDYLRTQALLDRNKTKIVDMTPLGLVEITRHASRR